MKGRYGVYDMAPKYRQFYDELKAIAKIHGIRYQDLVGELIYNYVMLHKSIEYLKAQ